MPALIQNGCGHDWRSVQELTRCHRLLAGALQFDNPNRALSAGDRESVVEDGARRAFADSLGGAQNLDASCTGKFEPGAGNRRQSAAMIVDLIPRVGPINARLALIDLVGVAHTLFGL